MANAELASIMNCGWFPDYPTVATVQDSIDFAWADLTGEYDPGGARSWTVDDLSWLIEDRT